MLKRSFALFIQLCIVVAAVGQVQPDTTIDVLHYKFNLELNDSNNVIKGEATITIKFLQDVNVLKLDLAQKQANDSGMLVMAVTQEGKARGFLQDPQHVFITTSAKAGQVGTYIIRYQGRPADGLIISVNRYKHRTFFGDNWPNRAHNWLPCKDHLSDKASVEFIVTAPEHYQVVANGLQTEETNLPNHRRLTHWEETAEIATKVMVIGVADFAVNYAGSVDGIPFYSWVYPEDRDAGFATYAMAKNILPFYISHVGPYAYKKLANVQSKTIFGGMENANAIFYYEKSVTAPDVEALLAHEIAHQWFGNTATEKNWQHLWLSEGFATYMTHLYHENKYGVDSFNKRLMEDRKIVIAFSKKRHTPVVDTTYGNDMMALLNANSYQKGGWVLHMLRRKLGDDVFWKCVRAYYATYAGKNANTDDLQKVFEDVSHQNLDTFFKQWLHTTGQPDLNIAWRYNAASHTISVTVEQKQAALFEFPLEIATNNGAKQTAVIKDKLTSFDITVDTRPSVLLIDPNVNLLYEGALKELR